MTEQNMSFETSRDRPYLKVNELFTGHLYKIHSRNLQGLGVYDGDGGFIGIRHKWGNNFLTTEIHWDVDEHHGTAKPLMDMGRVPDGVLTFDSSGGVVSDGTKGKGLYDYLDSLLTKRAKDDTLNGQD